MPSQCTITFNNPDEIYYVGDKIEGQVELATTKNKKIKKVTIRFKGVVACGFKLHTRVNNVPTDVEDSEYFFSKQRMIKTDQVVLREGILRARRYTWPFSFIVSDNCCTSMEGIHGHIRYYVALKIYNESKYSNIFFKPITVLKKVALNKKSERLSLVESKVSASYCCGLFRFGPDIRVSDFYRGYAPGQSFVYSLDMSNKIPGKQYDLEVTLTRKTVFLSEFPAYIESVHETCLYHSRPATIASYEEQHIEDAFIIPATPPTTKTKFITITYMFTVKLKVKCCPLAFIGAVPIEIGTIPLKETLTSRQQKDLPEGHQIAPNKYEKPGEYDSPFVNKKIFWKNRDDTFMPRYPMFSMM